MRAFFTFSQHHYTHESLAAERQFRLSTVRACAFCGFAIAFAGARGRVVVRRIALCFGFLAGVVGVFRWGSTLCVVVVWCFWLVAFLFGVFTRGLLSYLTNTGPDC
jgi:hypothetical protein